MNRWQLVHEAGVELSHGRLRLAVADTQGPDGAAMDGAIGLVVVRSEDSYPGFGV